MTNVRTESKDTPAENIPTVAIEDGTAIVIRIPLAYLPVAMDCAVDAGHVYGAHEVTEIGPFAEALVGELKEEKEDGTTLIHGLLDMAIGAAVENGAEGIAEVDEDEEDDDEDGDEDEDGDA